MAHFIFMLLLYCMSTVYLCRIVHVSRTGEIMMRLHPPNFDQYQGQNRIGLLLYVRYVDIG